MERRISVSPQDHNRCCYQQQIIEKVMITIIQTVKATQNTKARLWTWLGHLMRGPRMKMEITYFSTSISYQNQRRIKRNSTLWISALKCIKNKTMMIMVTIRSLQTTKATLKTSSKKLISLKCLIYLNLIKVSPSKLEPSEALIRYLYRWMNWIRIVDLVQICLGRLAHRLSIKDLITRAQPLTI